MASFGLIHDVKVRLSASLGRPRVTVAELFALKDGSVLKLDRAGRPVDIVLDGQVVARGRLVASTTLWREHHRNRHRRRRREALHGRAERICARRGAVRPLRRCRSRRSSRDQRRGVGDSLQAGQAEYRGLAGRVVAALVPASWRRRSLYLLWRRWAPGASVASAGACGSGVQRIGVKSSLVLSHGTQQELFLAHADGQVHCLPASPQRRRKALADRLSGVAA